MSSRRVSLAYQKFGGSENYFQPHWGDIIDSHFTGLTEIPQDLIRQGQSIEELDLTSNKISATDNDLRCLIDFPNLTTLILDQNGVTSQLKIPVMSCLHTLWVNQNKIANLSTFISTISQNCPQLKILSMMKNEAAPSYFNGGSYQQYMDYRYYVISQLPKLETLDDKKIETNEREEAVRIYRRTVPRARKKSKKKQDIAYGDLSNS